MTGHILSVLCALHQLMLPASSYASALAPAPASDELSNLQLLVPRLSAPRAPPPYPRPRDALLAEHPLGGLDAEPLAALTDNLVAKLGLRLLLETAARGDSDTSRLPLGNLLLSETNSRGDTDTLVLPLGNLLSETAARGDSDTSRLLLGKLLSEMAGQGDSDTSLLPFGNLLSEMAARGDSDTSLLPLGNLLSETAARGDSDTSLLPLGSLLSETAARGDSDTSLLPLGNLLSETAARGDSDTSRLPLGNLLSETAARGDSDTSRLPLGNLLLPETGPQGDMEVSFIPSNNLALSGLEGGQSDEVVEEWMRELCRLLQRPRAETQPGAALVDLTHALCNMYVEERDSNATSLAGAGAHYGPLVAALVGAGAPDADSSPRECPAGALQHRHAAPAACPVCSLLRLVREHHVEPAAPSDSWSLKWFGPHGGRRQWVDEPDQLQKMFNKMRKARVRRIPPDVRWQLEEHRWPHA